MNEQPIPSPFHQGERDIQARLGVRDKIEQIGQRFIRNCLPDEHRDTQGQNADPSPLLGRRPLRDQAQRCGRADWTTGPSGCSEMGSLH